MTTQILIEDLMRLDQLRMVKSFEELKETESYSQTYYFKVEQDYYQVSNLFESFIEHHITSHLDIETDENFQKFQAYVLNFISYNSPYTDDHVAFGKSIIQDKWNELKLLIGNKINSSLPDSIIDDLREVLKNNIIELLVTIFFAPNNVPQFFDSIKNQHDFTLVYSGYGIMREIQYMRSFILELTDDPIDDIDEDDHADKKDKLTHKQQILLLKKLDVFELPKVKKLTEQQRGKLFGYLLNRNEKNTEDYIRNRYTKDTNDRNSLYKPTVKAAVTKLLNELGIDNPEKM